MLVMIGYCYKRYVLRHQGSIWMIASNTGILLYTRTPRLDDAASNHGNDHRHGDQCSGLMDKEHVTTTEDTLGEIYSWGTRRWSFQTGA